MTTMGESQIIKFFTDVLGDNIRKTHGDQCKFVSGNFSGNLDRRFADVFAGTAAVNILIEFKRLKHEYRNEAKKPLRATLCRTLTTEMALLSRSCHFLGWGAASPRPSVELTSYIDLVCPLWDSTNPIPHVNYPHDSFITNFVKGTVGVDYDKFVRYIEHLDKIAGGSASGDQVPFPSMLYSYDTCGSLMAIKFDTLRELRHLIGLTPPDQHRSTPRAGRRGL